MPNFNPNASTITFTGSELSALVKRLFSEQDAHSSPVVGW